MSSIDDRDKDPLRLSGSLLCQCMLNYLATCEDTFWWESEVARVLTADEVKEAEKQHDGCAK